MLRNLRDLIVLALGAVSLALFIAAPVVLVFVWLAFERLGHSYP